MRLVDFKIWIEFVLSMVIDSSVIRSFSIWPSCDSVTNLKGNVIYIQTHAGILYRYQDECTLSEFYFLKTSPTLTGVYKGAIHTLGWLKKIMLAELNNICKLGHFYVEYITFNFSYCTIITILCYLITYYTIYAATILLRFILLLKIFFDYDQNSLANKLWKNFKQYSQPRYVSSGLYWADYTIV